MAVAGRGEGEAEGARSREREAPAGLGCREAAPESSCRGPYVQFQTTLPRKKHEVPDKYTKALPGRGWPLGEAKAHMGTNSNLQVNT